MMPSCPECGSKKFFKDGLRYTDQGSIQRFLCRVCGHRFSDNSLVSQAISKYDKPYIRSMTKYDNAQVCAILKEAKNLDTATVQKVAGEEINDQTIKGKILSYLICLTNEGKRPDTVKAHRKVLTRLARHGANLLDAESVKQTIARENVQPSTKAHYVGVYKVFADYCQISWKAPIYRYARKLPFIPLETEIDQLIAGFKRRTATFLQTMKESGARCGEVWALKWTDLNGNVLSINQPEKGSLARQTKISDKLVSMLQSLPRKDLRIFGPLTSLGNFRVSFIRKRKGIARTLSNPRLNQITFHTFRHYYATMLYAKTKNILLVQQRLGHKSIENTQVYTQLITFESDEYNHAHAATLKEEDALLDAGFEFVRYSEKDQVAIYRKRK